MASYQKKTNMPVAVNSHSNIKIRDKHQTTTNFMDVGVAFCRELCPDSGIHDLNMRSFARLDTMRAPTEGDAVVNSRAYFVPYRTICPYWNDFRNNTPHVYEDEFVAIPTKVPTLKNSELVRAFIYEVYSGASSENEYIRDYEGRITPEQADRYDFAVVELDTLDNTLVISGYDLTARGARMMKLLHQLGYGLDFNFATADTEHSALMLFSLVKIYLDHYFPSQYVQSQEYFEIDALLNYNVLDVPLSDYADYLKIRKLFDFIDKVCYSNDYFVSAWDNPNSPNAGASSAFAIPDINALNQTYQNIAKYTPNSGDDDAPRLQSNIGVVGGITQFGLNALRSLSDYLKRHQIVGSRVLDRMLARWGVVLTPAKLDRSVYISDFQQNIMFGDVTSTADTDGANLGAYAGKGILPEKNATFSYDTDEDGFFMILTSVVPIAGYYQGADRHTRHIELTDFFTPEFDALGTQAIAMSELYMPMQANKQYANNTPVLQDNRINYKNMIFGFTPRYAECKIGRDRLTGDYRLGSKNATLDAWHLFRDMDDFFYDKQIDEVSHDINFIRGLDSEQYNRLFNYQGDDTEKIKISHYFNYTLRWPGKQLYDTYEFADEDKSQKVSIDVGGSKAN